MAQRLTLNQEQERFIDQQERGESEKVDNEDADRELTKAKVFSLEEVNQVKEDAERFKLHTKMYEALEGADKLFGSKGEVFALLEQALHVESPDKLKLMAVLAEECSFPALLEATLNFYIENQSGVSIEPGQSREEYDQAVAAHQAGIRVVAQHAVAAIQPFLRELSQKPSERAAFQAKQILLTTAVRLPLEPKQVLQADKTAIEQAVQVLAAQPPEVRVGIAERAQQAVAAAFGKLKLPADLEQSLSKIVATATNVTFLKERRGRLEQGELNEAGKEDLAAFVKFVRTHEKNIVRAHRDGTLDAYIYREFYTKPETLPYPASTPELDAYFDQYDTDIWRMQSRLDTLPGVSTINTGKWVYAKVGTALKNRGGSGKVGRFYLNVVPVQDSIKVYEGLVAKAAQGRWGMEVKLPAHMSLNSANRPDKIVLYVDPEYCTKAAEALGSLGQEFSSSFQTPETPRFAAPVYGKQGQELRGIAFAQEPDIEDKSFGSLRALVMAEAYGNVAAAGQLENMSVWEQEFAKACEMFGVDSSNVAFNAKADHFASFRLKHIVPPQTQTQPQRRAA